MNPAALTADLVAEIALALARHLGGQGGPDKVSPEPGALPRGWLLFTPTELRILVLLVSGAALSRLEIARKLDENEDGRIKGILAGLVGRRCLLVSQEGYRLNVLPNDLADVKGWLAEITASDPQFSPADSAPSRLNGHLNGKSHD